MVKNTTYFWLWDPGHWLCSKEKNGLNLRHFKKKRRKLLIWVKKVYNNAVLCKHMNIFNYLSLGSHLIRDPHSGSLIFR